ncbi:MAG: hypothetical protein DI551_01030 [Micavibrio aeruginosavorus]|uniref:Uncharacterized protein n=1 Tax=Micavibrio aeruginosavorus TaxID=349221 RepID=A0A2W5N832_9BACT|nr:MAG: hypothetical protein DI551_01030 [Micavibrio aeruginosavorus]
MGSSADDFLTDLSLKEAGGHAYKGILNESEDTASREGMTLRDSLRLHSGKTAKHYGTPRPA